MTLKFPVPIEQRREDFRVFKGERLPTVNIERGYLYLWVFFYKNYSGSLALRTLLWFLWNNFIWIFTRYVEFSVKIGFLAGSTFRFSSNILAKLRESGGMKFPYRGNARGVRIESFRRIIANLIRFRCNRQLSSSSLVNWFAHKDQITRSSSDLVKFGLLYTNSLGYFIFCQERVHARSRVIRITRKWKKLADGHYKLERNISFRKF